MNKLLVHFRLIAFLMIFQACSMIELKKESPEINHIPENTKFKIILPEDHRTGYIWQLQQNYDPTVIERINEVWHGNDKGVYFNLKSLASGQATLTFISRKYTDTADIKHFIVKIDGK